MNIDEVVDGYVAYLKALSEKKFYAFCHGTSCTKDKAWKEYTKMLNLKFSQYKLLADEHYTIGQYVEAQLDPPPKKVVVPKKKPAKVEDNADADW